MDFFFSDKLLDKTTAIIQYTYDHLLQQEDDDNFAILLSHCSSDKLNSLTFGKYESVNRNTLDRIFNKYIEKYEDLITFLDSFFFVNEENYPAIIAIDNLNKLLDVVRKLYCINIKILFKLSSVLKISQINQPFITIM